MRLSASINLFDGEELLAPLLRNLRPQVDHVSVVYQTVSWWGLPAAASLVPMIESLRHDGWIDDLTRYDAGALDDEAARKQHEARKRTVGIELARAAGATHLLSLDVDELYRPSELRWAKALVEAEGYDVTACRVQDYHARPTHRCRQLAQYHGIDVYVPFLCRVTPDLRFDTSLDFFRPVDPSRRVPHRLPHAFAPSEIVMHHMTTVRGSVESLVSKFASSSSRSRFSLEDPRALAWRIWSFDPSRDGAPAVVTVPDEFDIGGIRAGDAVCAPAAVPVHCS